MPTTLHPRSTADTDSDRRAALQASVSDPLWMIARQWQTGEFIADDTGTPAYVTIATHTSPLHLTDNDEPISQAIVEAEPPTSPDDLDTASRGRLAMELIRHLHDHDIPAEQTADIQQSLADAYPLHPVTPTPDLLPYRRRLPDPAPLLHYLAAALDADGTGTFPNLPGLPDPADHAVEAAVRTWYAWAHRQLQASGTTSHQPPFWQLDHLSYHADAAADQPNGELQLRADRYDGTGLDWYTFDLTAAPPPQATTAPPVQVRPTPVAYAGMPGPRYWAFERGDVNLDTLANQDPAHSLLVTFAHAYSNDWFLIPCDVPSGITIIESLQVTDTFSTTTAIPATSTVDGPTSQWRMWELTTDSETPTQLSPRLFLNPAPSTLGSPPLDEAVVVRDEMANLGWIVEITTSDADGNPVDRNRRWIRLRPATDPSFHPATRSEATSYRLGTTLPDYWYPLTTIIDADGTIDLALAELPEGSTDVNDTGVAGNLLPHQPTTHLADEEASRTGTRLQRVIRLTRSPNGRHLWRARIRSAGTGEGSSGLRFDILATPASPPNLVANSDFTQARRSPPAPLTGSQVAGQSAAQQWGLWNTDLATTTTRVEPTTRPGGTGWMLHISTTAARCGLVQQWATTARPPAAYAEAWVYVQRGVVGLGCGSGGDTTIDIATATTGRWEHLQAPSGRPPVNQVIVHAASPDGADFVVDLVTVRPV